MLLANEVHATRAFICVQPALGKSINASAEIITTEQDFKTSIIDIPGLFINRDLAAKNAKAQNRMNNPQRRAASPGLGIRP
jgi:hypothetical protein